MKVRSTLGESEEVPVIVSASRRTDLPCSHPDFLEAALAAGRAEVAGPFGSRYEVDLRPERVHTIVFWSKNYSNLFRARLRRLLRRYSQLFFHFTITGLGGSHVEDGAPPVAEALRQIPGLVDLAGSPDRLALRFDPIVFWSEQGRTRSNLDCFREVSAAASRFGVRRIVTSFAQWYGKSLRRAQRRHFEFVDLPIDEKSSFARELGAHAASIGSTLSICSQRAISEASGVPASRCIDGELLSALHPTRIPLDSRKDPGQRPDCRCSRSRDIGSYSQLCSSACVYCYATPAL